MVTDSEKEIERLRINFFGLWTRTHPTVHPWPTLPTAPTTGVFFSLMTHPPVSELVVRAKSSSPSARPATVFPRPSQMWQLLEALKSSAGSVSAITSQREGPLLLHEASRATSLFTSYHARSRTDRSRQRDSVRRPEPAHVGAGPCGPKHLSIGLPRVSPVFFSHASHQGHENPEPSGLLKQNGTCQTANTTPCGREMLHPALKRVFYLSPVDLAGARQDRIVTH